MTHTLFFRRCLLVGGLSAACFNGWAQVNFSRQGGYQSEGFGLELSADEGLQIYYTTDGTIPTVANATLYTVPLEIATTTPVSAIAVDAEGNVSERSVRTYIFLDDVYRQPAAPAGYPLEWSAGYKADYAMDQSITLGDTYASRMDSAMRSLPVVCITTSVSCLFDPDKGGDDCTGGIYIFPEEKGEGREWERPASIEFYDQKGWVQQNCGLRIHGGNSRKPGNTPKHSFRVSFRKEYGDGKLRYRVFDDEDAKKKFDHLVLRAGYNYSWLKNGSKKLYPKNIVQRTNAQYVIDAWTKEAAHSMGHTITHRRFVHLFLNGLYWGLYEVNEKIGDAFCAQYLGGEAADWDVVEDHYGVMDGDRSAFTQMYDHAVKATSENDHWEALSDEELLDVQQFADYMLLQWYIGNEDWDENNWRAIRNRVVPDGGFRFMVWDAEMGMIDLNTNRVTLKKGEPTKMVAAMKQNEAFLRILDERIRLHLTGDGILTPAQARALYQRLCDEIDFAIIGESARWGDYRVGTGETTDVYTRDEFWVPRRDYLLDTYFAQRTGILLEQLEQAGLYGVIPHDAISEVRNDDQSGQVLYNLSGQRVTRKAGRGFYVKGGRVISE